MLRFPPLNEFSPGQLGGAQAVFELLEQFNRLGPERKRIQEWIRERWFSEAAPTLVDNPDKRRTAQWKRAGNVLSGMNSVGLIELSRNQVLVTDIGERILTLRNDPSTAFDYFATHLLREHHGLALLEAAQTVMDQDGKVQRTTLAQELRSRGFKLETNPKYFLQLRLWLEMSGVVDDRWVINDVKLRELAIPDIDEVRTWRGLRPEARAVIKILRIRDLGNQLPIQSPELVELMRQHGVTFDEAQIGKHVYEPLDQTGLIHHHVVRGGGRGGKGGTIELSEEGRSLDVDLIDNLELGNVPADLRKELRKPTSEIIDDLGSSDTYVKGQALELLSLRMTADLGLMPVEMRERSARTGGAEVDLVAEGAHLHFSRWLIQCKNQQNPVTLGVLAKEIGMATLLKAHVVVIVSTGTFAKTLRDYAKKIVEDTHIQVQLLDEGSLRAYKLRGPGALRDELRGNAEDVMLRKRQQLDGVRGASTNATS